MQLPNSPPQPLSPSNSPFAITHSQHSYVDLTRHLFAPILTAVASRRWKVAAGFTALGGGANSEMAPPFEGWRGWQGGEGLTNAEGA